MTQPTEQTAPPDATADRHLLTRFLELGDDDAFAELVRLHGPMVLATCRRCLGNTPDADDAFQAVFVILARKAASVRQRDLLGPWLHAVAVRAAVRTRALAAQRRQRERQVNPMPEPEPRPAPPSADWLGLVHEEIECLPERYRAAVVLCDLQGTGRAEAAEALGIPEGTVSSRLARGRELLRQRLLRRGVAVTAGALALLLAQDTRAAVPPDLVRSTVRAAAAGAASAPVAAIIEGVVRIMFLTKLKNGAIACLAAIGFAGAAVPLLLLAADAQKEKADRELLQGTWQITAFEEEGQKVDENDQKLKERPVFEDDKIRTSDRVLEFKLDPKQNPKHIDFTLDGEDQGKQKGIYELKGDDLKICIGPPDGDRPTKLETAAGSKSMLFTLKRVK